MIHRGPMPSMEIHSIHGWRISMSGMQHINKLREMMSFVGLERVAWLDAISGLQRDRPGAKRVSGVNKGGLGFLMVTDHRLR